MPKGQSNKLCPRHKIEVDGKYEDAPVRSCFFLKAKGMCIWCDIEEENIKNYLAPFQDWEEVQRIQTVRFKYKWSQLIHKRKYLVKW